MEKTYGISCTPPTALFLVLPESTLLASQFVCVPAAQSLASTRTRRRPSACSRLSKHTRLGVNIALALLLTVLSVPVVQNLFSSQQVCDNSRGHMVVSNLCVCTHVSVPNKLLYRMFDNLDTDVASFAKLSRGFP